MIKALKLILITAVSVPGFMSCENLNKSKSDDRIVFNTVDQELVLIRNLELLRNSNDEVSQHVDSIISGLIDTEFISTGFKSL